MAVPSFLQSQTYSTNTAATSHQISLPSSVRAQGGTIGPSTLVLTASYDGTIADNITSVTDSKGNTWQKGTSATNGAATNGEMWYAYNVKPGNTTLTINLGSSQKLTAVVVEVDQVRPVSPLDQTLARIDTTNSTARTSAATNTTRRNGQQEIVIGGIAWTSTTLNCTNSGSGFTQLVAIKDGSSFIGAAMNRRNADLNNTTGSNTIGRFTMSATSTAPCATMSLSFYRDGVVTAGAEDGWIQDLETVMTVFPTDTSGFVIMTSTSAPGGGTGSSEKDNAFFFFSDYTANLLAGVTIDETITCKFNVVTCFDDGFGYMQAAADFYKNNQLGNSLDTGDNFLNPDLTVYLGTGPFNLTGINTFTFSKSSGYNASGTTALKLELQGDTQGGSNGSYFEVSFWEGNVPAFLVLPLLYPALGTPQRCLLGVGL